MAVTEQEVRDLLDNPAATSVPAATITSNITRSEAFVTDHATSTATTAQKDEAAKAMAVWLTYGSYMEGITQQLGAISIADQVKLDHFRRVAEIFLNEVSQETISLSTDASDMKEVTAALDVNILTTTEAFEQ